MCLLWLLLKIKLSSIFLFFSMVLKLHRFHLISWILQIRPWLKTGNLVSVISKIFEKLVNMRIVGCLEFSFFLILNIILGLVMWLDLLALYLRFWFVEWYLCCNSIYQRFWIGLNLLFVLTNLSLLEMKMWFLYIFSLKQPLASYLDLETDLRNFEF